MPEQRRMEVKTREVREGDLLFDGHQFLGEVVRIKIGDKWAHYTFLVDGDEGLKPHSTKFLLDTVVDIERVVPTEAEKLAEARADAERNALHHCQRAFARVEQTTAGLVEAARWAVDSQWSRLSPHMEALAERDLWAEVLRTLGVQRNDGPVIDFLKAIEIVAQEQRERVLNNWIRGRSTSAASNFASDTLHDVTCAWLRSFTVHSVERVVKDEEAAQS